jgi:transcriptional regulator with XRE-family HTH domain
MALRLSRTSITNIERGRQPVQLHTLYKIAALLDAEPTALLPGASQGELGQATPNLKQNEWLRKIAPKGEFKNATSPSKNPARGTRAP